MRLAEEEEKSFNNLELPVPSKVNLDKEWVLVLFTILVPVLTGLMAAGTLGWRMLNPWIYMGAGLIGLMLSSVHLGKKLRAWRSVLNIRNSWLSREILGYGLFLGSSFLWFIRPDIQAFGYGATLLGFATSYVIDKVYLPLERQTRLGVQSNNIFLSALLFTSLLTFNDRFAGLVLLIKLMLYLYRKIYYLSHDRKVNYLMTSLRILSGFLVPAWIWINMEIDPLWITGLILVGELFDRAEFYLEGEVINPKRQIVEDLVRLKAG